MEHQDLLKTALDECGLDLIDLTEEDNNDPSTPTRHKITTPGKVETKVGSSLNKTSSANMCDLYAGIRIKNPLISKAEMKSRMDGRQLIRLSMINSKKNVFSNDIEGDWVTIGIISHKMDPKTSKNGKKFSIFKLTDLKSEKTASFFLFGDVHTEHWKLPVGTVIGLLNPSFLADNGDTKYAKNEICSLTIDHHAKVMVMGMAMDLGFCKGVRRDGAVCGSMVNLAETEHCVYHLRNAYKRLSAQRAEIQHTFSNLEPTRAACPKKAIQLQSDLTFESDFYDNSTSTNATKKSTEAVSIDLESKKINKEELMKKKADESKVLSKLIATPLTLASRNLANSIRQKRHSPGPARMAVIKSFKEVLGVMNTNEVRPKRGRKPKLAKGYRPGQMIELEVEDPKQKAIEVLKRKPIEKEDPNNIFKKVKLEKWPQTFVENKTQTYVNDKTNQGSQNSKEVESEESKARSKQKREWIESILKRKSKHDNEVAAVEAEAEEKYFDLLEKKEKLENKMSTTTEIFVDVFTCTSCKPNLTSQAPSEICKRKQHKIIRRKVYKRFFKCKNCNIKVHVYDYPFPTAPCRECGGKNYEKTSMYNVKDGPKLPNEQLLIRGEEIKFL